MTTLTIQMPGTVCTLLSSLGNGLHLGLDNFLNSCVIKTVKSSSATQLDREVRFENEYESAECSEFYKRPPTEITWIDGNKPSEQSVRNTASDSGYTSINSTSIKAVGNILHGFSIKIKVAFHPTTCHHDKSYRHFDSSFLCRHRRKLVVALPSLRRGEVPLSKMSFVSNFSGLYRSFRFQLLPYSAQSCRSLTMDSGA